MAVSPLDQLHELADQITPISLPGCYQRPEFRFCRVGFTKDGITRKVAQIKADSEAESTLKRFKKPFGTAWQIKTFKSTDRTLSEWLAHGGNYGVVAGGEWQHEDEKVRLYLHDADDVKAWTVAGFFDDLPKRTMVVQSSAENKQHFYFLSNIKSTKAHSELPPVGHLKFERSQVVAAGSLHPSGCRYILIDETAPAYVDTEILTNAIVSATKVLLPDKVAEVKEMLGVKTTAGRLKENADLLDEKLKQAKVDRLKRNQQQEAQAEAAYNAAKTTISTQADINAQEEELKARIKPIEGLIKEIGEDNTINLCLRRLNASIPTLNRFEKAVSYQGKPGEGEHFLRRAWAVALIKSGYPDSKIHQMAQHFDDYTQARTQQQIDSIRTWVDGGGKYYPCDEIRSYLPPEIWCQECSWTPPEQDQTNENTTTVTDSGGETTGQTQDPEIYTNVKKAGDNILARGKVLKFVIKQFHKNHVGDEVAGKVLTLSYLSGSSLTSNGIQPGITGDAQTGKSDAMDAALHTLPQEWVMRTGLSDKAAAYIEFVPGQVVHSDDLKWTDGLIYMLKISMSKFQTGAEYTTVMKKSGQLTAVPLKIPPRILWWITGADAAPDDQIESRQYPVDVDQAIEHAVDVMNAIASRRASRKTKFYVDNGILTCRYILGQVRESGPFKVEIPYSQWIDYKVPEDYRGQQQFFDLIDALAILNFKQRKVIDGWIQADLQDFYEAKAIFTSKNESHNTGLTAAELQLVRAMVGKGPCTQADLVTYLGKSQATVAKRLQSIMGKTAYITCTKDRGEAIYRTNKVDISIFGNVIIGWKKSIPTRTSLTPVPLCSNT